MKKIFAFLLTIFILSVSYAQQDKRFKGIEKELNLILKSTNAAGFAVAVVEGDKIVYAQGFGYSDYENKIPVDANTLFAIGSSTKAFTSSILGQLSKEDKISLDDSPKKYIPELKFYNDEMNENIIIKDLMCHRTGLPRHDFSWYYFQSHSKDSLLARVAYHEPFAGVREQWYYNNFMFLAQGIIAEKITEKSWETNIQERFFTPLEMNRSNSSLGELMKSSNYSFGYSNIQDTIIEKVDFYDIAGMSPAGSINSSVNDMSNWLITWINNGKFKGKEIIPSNYIADAIGSHMVVSSGLPDPEFPDISFSNYGYGWFITSYKGHYRVEHGGNIDGFSANVAFFPSDSIGIVVLTNQNGSPVPTMVRNTMADIMLKTTKTNWVGKYNEIKKKEQKEMKEMESAVSEAKIPNTKPSHPINDYTGKYGNLGYGEFNITNKNDSLFAQVKSRKLYLKHVHYDVFEPFEVTKEGIDTTDSGMLLFNFLSNDMGEISSVNLKIEPMLNHSVEFKRKAVALEIDRSILEKYVGEYEVPGASIKVYTKGENVLYFFVPGQPEYEMMATGEHKFTFKDLDGFKVEFIESDDHSINEMNLIQPNGVFKAKKKK